MPDDEQSTHTEWYSEAKEVNKKMNSVCVLEIKWAVV